MSVVRSGALAGVSLRQLVRDQPRALLGEALSRRARRDQFPLRVKFLDAHDVLSVQVHPDDALAPKLANDNGKTEAWVIVHAEPGSLIYAGLNRGVSREEFAAAMERGNVEPLLHRFEVKPGDCVFVPAGTVHAIGAGIILAEIQQSSDATFRVYDWGRVGADGNPRALHPSESLASTDFAAGPVNPVHVDAKPLPDRNGTSEQLVTCPYFALTRLTLAGKTTVGTSDRFTILMGLGGESALRHPGRGDGLTPLEFGNTLLLPAAFGECDLVAAGEGSVVLSCVVP